MAVELDRALAVLEPLQSVDAYAARAIDDVESVVMMLPFASYSVTIVVWVASVVTGVAGAVVKAIEPSVPG